MKNNNIILAREKYNQTDYLKAKEFYDLFLHSHIANTNHLKVTELREITNEYIDVVVKLNKFNISTSNFLFIKFDETNELLLAKFENNEPLSEYEENVSKMLMYKPFYKLNWGEHKGLRIIDVVEKEPENILWSIINLDHFSVDNVIFLFSQVIKEPAYLNALVVNLIKQLIISKWRHKNEQMRLGNYDDSNNYNYSYDDRDAFYGITDGMFGDYEDFNGDIDDMWSSLGRES